MSDSNARAILGAVIPPGRCPTCLERTDSQLHHELCVVTAPGARRRKKPGPKPATPTIPATPTGEPR